MKGKGLSFLRVVDANLNRAREGLRVCEEVARFILEEPRLTHRCRQIRYDLNRLSRSLGGAALVKARDSRRDVGRPAVRGKGSPHRGIRDLVAANSRRIQEAFRVLEEFTRLSSVRSSKEFGHLRFRVYSLEQDLLSEL